MTGLTVVLWMIAIEMACVLALALTLPPLLGAVARVIA
jgi:hypothetical protein